MSKIPYHHSVNQLIDLEDLPSSFDGVKDNLQERLSKVYYSNLQAEINNTGSSAYYSINLITFNGLSWEIPGTHGMILIINPNQNGDSSIIPLSVSYRLEILDYLHGLSLSNLSGNPKDYLDLLLDILDLDVKDLVETTIGLFIEDDVADQLDEFVNLINTEYGSNTVTSYTDVDDVVNQLESSVGAANAVWDILLNTSIEEVWYNLKLAFFTWVGDIDTKNIIKLFIPVIHASLNQISLGIIFPKKILRRVDNTTLEPLKDDNGEDVPTMLLFDAGKLHYLSEEGFEFEDINTIDLPLSEIGKTGLIIQFDDIALDLSKKRNLSQADADGRDSSFIGVYASDSSIILPKKWFKNQNNTTARIYGRNLLIGTGGISGNIGLEALSTNPPTPGQEPELSLKLGTNSGFEVALNRFNVAFQQNSIISSDVKGSITIPNFKQIDNDGNAVQGDLKLGVMMHFTEDGDFNITADPYQDNLKIGIEGVFSFDVDTFAVGRKEDRFYVEVSGGLNITANFGNDVNLPKGLEIPKLRIWEDGSFEMPLDKPPFPSEVRLIFKPVELYVSNMHIGSYEKNGRPYKYFGFDGGIDTNPTSVDAKGTGIKLYFSVDGGPLDIFVRIQRIDIDLIIPAGDGAENAALVLKGFLAVRDGGNGTTEYAGGVDITLPRLNFRGSAAMRLNPQKPNFIVDAQIEMNKGIPLGSTGLSIYGFRGLVGKNYVATKDYPQGVTDEDPWWKYYKAPPAEGTHIDKFKPTEGFSLGAGVSLATTLDSGLTFSSKLFFLLSLPNVFLFEGKAAILKERIGLDSTDEPPFFAMLSIDDTSIEAAIGVDYKMPEDGNLFKKIAHLYGVMELGFFRGDASAWYVNIGRDLPEDMRVQAKIGDLFTAYAYLMLSAKQIKLGAGVDFGREYVLPEDKETVKLALTAYIDIAAKINFKPQQFGGSLALGGTLGIKVFGVGIGLSADAMLAGETPQPYIIIGKIGVAFKVIKTFKFEIEMEWTRDPNPNTAEITILNPAISGELPVKATNILTKDQYPLLYIDATDDNIPALEAWGDSFENYGIPLDSFIDFEFAKGVKPFTAGDNNPTKIGGVTTGYRNMEVFPPEKAKTTPLNHEYEVENIAIKYWDIENNVWQDYHVYDALTSLTDLPFIAPSDLTNKKHGYWQMEKPERYSKLRILAQTPISYMTQTAVPTPLEEFGITYQTLFCEDSGIQMNCYNWREQAVNTIYSDNLTHVLNKGLMIQLDRDVRVATNTNNFGITPSLRITNGGTMTLLFHQPIAQSNLKLKTALDTITFKYYKRVQTVTANDQAPVMTWQLLHQVTKTKSQMNSNAVIYDNDNIEKIVIEIPENVPQEGVDFVTKHTFLHEVCWMTMYDYQFNQTLVNNDGVQQEADELLQGLNKIIQPIWRPNTNYVIQVKVKDKLSNAANMVYETYHNYGFKTRGPIGHFHQQDTKYNNLITEQKDQYRLADLRSYVDFTKSYPNADGNLLSAKPLFYEHPKLSLFFIKPYVYTMFNNFDTYANLAASTSKLNAVIKDPVDQPSATVSGTRIATASWRETPYGAVEQDVQMINNLIVNGTPCVETTVVNPPNVAADLITDVLKPLKNYTAIINSEFEGNANEVLRYVFETSRYPDFKTQIGSYVLSEATGLKAAYKIELVNPNFGLIESVFNDTIVPEDNLNRDFANHFDRLMFALGLQAQEVAMTTETNVITHQGRIVGVWLRSPEPFNDPKIPTTVFTNLFSIEHSSINPNAFKTIVSKDGANLFISINSMNLPNGELILNIPYLEFDGQQYQMSSNPAHQADAIIVEL